MPPQPSIWSLCLELISPSICSEVMHFLNSFFSFFTPQFRTPPWHSTISSSGPFSLFQFPYLLNLEPRNSYTNTLHPKEASILTCPGVPKPLTSEIFLPAIKYSLIDLYYIPFNVPPISMPPRLQGPIQGHHLQGTVLPSQSIVHHCSFQGFAELCWGAEPTSLPLIVLLYIHLLVYSIKIYWAIFMCKILC